MNGLPRTRAGRLSIFFLVVAFAALLAGCGRQQQAAQAPPIEVGVIKVATAPVTVYEEYVAQTQAPDTIELRAQVTGLLQRQVVADGARVSKGDLLYQIDARPFQVELERANANLAQAQAALTNAQQTLDRYRELVGQGFVSKQAYQDALAQQRQATAAVAAERARVREARINRGYTDIHAPADGYLSQSRVRPGALITAQQTLLNTLYSSDPMYVYFTVSEEKLLALQKSMPAGGANEMERERFRLYLTDGTEYRFRGALDFVDSAVDESTGTLRARVSVPNPDRMLRPGMFVRLSVPALSAGSAITVPQKAVTELQGLKTVYVVGPDNKPQARQIVADTRAGSGWVVEKGLAPGELVVVEGLPKIQLMPDAPVKPVMVAGTDAQPQATQEGEADDAQTSAAAAPAERTGTRAPPSSQPPPRARANAG